MKIHQPLEELNYFFFLQIPLMASCSLIHKIAIFLLLWLAYGVCYLLRKPFGIVKADIQDSWHLSDNLIGYLDFAFSLPYALCSLFFAFLPDIFGARKTLGCGLLGAGIACSLMGQTEFYYELCILIFINGCFQSLCWPATCSILASWFDEENMSSVMAIYGSCMLTGGICSALLTVSLQAKSGWRGVFAIPSLVVVVIGLMVLFFGQPNTAKLVGKNNSTPKQIIEIEHRPLSIKKVMYIPSVPEISVALFFIKGLRTATMFWLPLYLTKALHFSARDSGLVPLTFEVGGLVGSVIIIVVLDKILKISDLVTCTVAALLCFVSFPFLLISHGVSVILLHLILLFTGAFSAIAEIILCGSLPSKIGEEVKARASVVGVINGFGSLGNVIEGPLVAWLSSLTGIKSFVWFCSLSSLFSMLCTLKAYLNSRTQFENDDSDTNNDINSE